MPLAAHDHSLRCLRYNRGGRLLGLATETASESARLHVLAIAAQVVVVGHVIIVAVKVRSGGSHARCHALGGAACGGGSGGGLASLSL